MNVMSSKWIDISIIIPLYKGKKYCNTLLNMINENCLYKELYRNCKIEVIFVNDYPNEKIVIDDRDKIFDIRVIEQEKNKGIHNTRITGVLNAKGEYIVMLDQDDLIMNNYLYNQWHKIIGENANFCVCNGWKGRFKVLWQANVNEGRINNLKYYLTQGNPICSPGQVIIRKSSLPKEWIENIQHNNGADDFFLWIIVLKMGERFIINNEYLYYHTPERSVASIDFFEMIESVKETLYIIKSKDLLEKDEIKLLEGQIDDKRVSLKFRKMFQIMLDWMKIKNKGKGIYSFLEENNYLNIAIYGLGYIGECLYDELCETRVNIKYCIDYMALDVKKELPIFRFEDDLVEVDAVVMTMIEVDEVLVEKVKKKLGCPVLTVSEILLELDSNIV